MTTVLVGVELGLLDAAGRELAILRVTPLNSATWNGLPLLLDHRGTGSEVSASAPVQLLEESTYEYEVVCADSRSVSQVGPEEFVSPSNERARGRISTGRLVGTVDLRVEFSDGSIGSAELEVRSRKLDYETEYRSMLSRIAEETAELAQSAFAASNSRAFRADAFSDPITLYQRFAFLRSLIDSEVVRDALAVVANRPHSEHRAVTEPVDPGRGVAAGASLARQLVKAGPRRPIAVPVHGLQSLPLTVSRTTHSITYDTVPNRFVRYVLERWRATAHDVLNELKGESPTARRGRREATEVIDLLSQALLCPALHEAGRLTTFPQSNQVLQGRDGYRDIFEAFVLAEVAPCIEWGHTGRLFSVGLRDIAELYEYWTYLELVRIIGTIPGVSVDKSALLKARDGALSLDLRRGAATTVVATTARRGASIRIAVNFNRRFPSGLSWSIGMHPDCSVCVKRDGDPAEVWLHFDAKYRVSTFDFGAVDNEATAAEEGGLSDDDLRPRVADMMKMHAYRDAIIGSVGSFVLYPGSPTAPSQHRQMSHELLPGIGAFVLRPEADGRAGSASVAELRRFLDEAIDHIAAQGTALERNRFWYGQSASAESAARLKRTPFVTRPAQDTSVLLGYVTGREHFDWVMRSGMYNLRADLGRAGAVTVGSAELSTDLLLLYNASEGLWWLGALGSEVSLQTKDDLLRTGYPGPGGEHYFCVSIQTAHPVTKPPLQKVADLALARSGGPFGKPAVVTWFELIQRTDMVWA